MQTFNQFGIVRLLGDLDGLEKEAEVSKVVANLELTRVRDVDQAKITLRDGNGNEWLVKSIINEVRDANNFYVEKALRRNDDNDSLENKTQAMKTELA